ncbi:hypothetical protein BMS3Abin17_00920 [archaeon BMS3Abin17]|nr:hypothetical protein BMS3Abin17_00920 [archaeon BMS3Abin17]HDZ61403.1 hypothetical protein [Candidatus Pacearchaeota archaeon]
MKKKKGLSGVITAIILIALVMTLVGIVWGVVKGILDEKLEGAKSCFGNFEKVKLNNRDTCYYNNTKEFNFYISIGDIDIDGVLILIKGNGTGKSIKIPGNYSYVKPYGGGYGQNISLPSKNSGLTYILNTTGAGIQDPNTIQIAPVINSKKCEVSDSLAPVDRCG